MKQFVKKRDISQAIQFDGSKKSFDEIQKWRGKDFKYNYQSPPTVFFNKQAVIKGDWIIYDAEFRVWKKRSNKDFIKEFVEVK